MWDHIREWAVVIVGWVVSLVGLTAYIVSRDRDKTQDIALVSQRVTSLEVDVKEVKQDVRAEMNTLKTDMKESMGRIESKLDLVLYKSEYRS